MFKILISVVVGFIIGIIMTTIALCKKNLEQYEQIKKTVEKQAEAGKMNYRKQLEVISGEIDGTQFEAETHVVFDILEHLYNQENKSDYKEAVLAVYDVLEPFCQDEENTYEENTYVEI